MDSKSAAPNGGNKATPDGGPARQIISAGIIVFRRTTEGIKYLILYHGRDYWNFPKGKLEKSERSWQAAFREVREETGLKSTELKMIGNFKAFEKFSYRRGNERIFKVVILYLAETKQATITVSDEHEGYGWFRFGEAKKIMSKFKDSLKILERAHTYLLKGERAHPAVPVPALPVVKKD